MNWWHTLWFEEWLRLAGHKQEAITDLPDDLLIEQVDPNTYFQEQ